MSALDYKLDASVARSGRALPGSSSLFVDSGFVREFHNRLSELEACAREADEPVSKASASELLDFLSQVPFTRTPGVFLLDNGNFRVVWRSPEHEQAAFQFRGDSVVHCVFLYRRDSQALPLSRETVVDLIDNVSSGRAEYAHILNDPAYEPRHGTGRQSA